MMSTRKKNRDLIQNKEKLEQEKKIISKKKDKSQFSRSKKISEEVDKINETHTEIKKQLEYTLSTLPNLALDDVPVGKDDSENIVIRTSKHVPEFDFKPLPHWELSENLGIIDFARGVKLSGSRFYLLKGAGARLQRALISWLLDTHTTKHGYQELYLPYLVSRNTVTGSGHLPKFADTMYHDEEDDMWLVPTAEVPITNIHSAEIMSLEQFPLKYVSHTPCFRREKAAAGNDTRGIKRGHQFDKVEMYQFVEPLKSQQALEQIVTDAESVCEELKIPHRVKLQCTGDMGFSVVKTYDIELWAAGCNEWLEVSSCSNCKDFQARRANIRYRPESDARPEFVHTLNGSGLGIPRTMACIMEHYQQADGSILVPEVLQPYTGFTKID